MQIKTYQAIDMAEAIVRIKADLGPNAVILSSRKVKNGNGGYGILARPLIEVTAAADEEVRRDQQRRRAPRKQPAAAKPETRAAGAHETFAAALSPLRDEIRELRELIGAASGTGAVGRTELDRAAGLSDDIGSLKSMMSFMLENTKFYKGLNLEPNYLVCYRRLVERGVEHEYALKLIAEVKESVPGGRELDLKTIVGLVIARIQETMIVGEPLTAATAAEGPRVIALIGPTGVGKTTTLAKIAAQLAMQGKKVGLITIDTYRIAAVEQLRTYAQILGLPLEVVLTPRDLPRALTALANRDVILIDTAGRSQRDAKKLNELAGFVGDAAIENYLVLSAGSDAAALDEAVRNFGCVNLAGLIFTKLDESAKPGVVVAQNYKTGLPVVYCTTGQRVPEDIEAASGRRLGARLFKKEA
ncbi:MAG: flagellar biosynthesis protein FlhF [Nitrospinae bacterium]|nr:flagellar biosynthesis protein FlhF [Nitrospinota bacterium]